ncbi:alpha/beta fold hydrolase [Ideonella sp. DXS29W]|uniref:Alpha/beta fold hydrolase n=1 Tax=Ideonella lacteola TaxID=2984193 RepID=A0ABU9BXN5_9BURK
MSNTETNGRDAWPKRVEEIVRQAIMQETKLPAHQLASDTTFEEYGIESVMVVAITRRLEETFGELAKTLFFEFQTIRELAGFLAREYPQPAAEPAPAPAPAVVKAEPIVAVAAPAPVAVAAAPVPVQAAAPAPVVDAAEPGAAMPCAFLLADEPAAAPEPQDEPIAIIGMSGRFPKADNLDEFWANLVAGKNCISEVPAELWDWREIWTTEKGVEGKSYTRWGGFMNDVDKFDPLFFNISNLEAQSLDPQERLFLETVYHTIEDAGYAREQLAGRKVGVYAGAMWSQYQLYGVDSANAGSSYASIANRVSYWFNFTGPSIGLDTMCSSSLTTVHLACESLRRGETELAIAGGVNVTVHPNKYMFLSKTGFASTEGLCRAYGEGGDGYVPGDGVGALLLKPLSAAQRDGDRILALIRGSAINHGGKSNAYTVPNPKLQASLIKEALDAARVDPRTISYIEGHGTGTALGDPIEVRALTQVFGESSDEVGYCALGSVKSNVGHLESAAGFAGIAKVVLQMRHRQLVPSIHTEVLNKNIDFDKTPFVVQRTLAPWRQPVIKDEQGGEIRVPRRAGVSSFGAGGANGHVVLEEFVEPPQATAAVPASSQLFVFSAKNNERLQAVVQRFVASALSDAPARVATGPAAEEVLGVVAGALGVSARLLDADDAWADLSIDFWAAERIARRVNEAFETALTADDVLRAGTVGQLCALCGGAGSATGANEPERFANLAYTLQVGREAQAKRLAVEADNFGQLRERLERFLAGAQDIDGVSTSPASNRDRVQADGEQDQEFLRSLARGRKWAKLARLWCHGASVLWAECHRGWPVRRVDLPLYPFAKERCWVNTAATAKPVAAASGLAAQLNALQSLDGTLRFDLRWDDAAADGAAEARIMGWIGEAADFVGERGSANDVRWQRGATLDAGAPLTLEIAQGPAGSEAPAVRLLDAAAQPLAGAVLRQRDESGSEVVAATTDLAAIRARCPQALPAFRAAGVGIDEAVAGEQTAVVRYQLAQRTPPAWQAALALVDAAAGLVARAWPGAAGSDASAWRVEHVRLVGVSAPAGSMFLRMLPEGGYAVDALDAEGRIWMTARGLRANQGDPVLERMFYRPEWVEQALPKAEPAADATGAVVLVYPSAAAFVAEGLKKRLDRPVHEIVLGGKTAVLSARSWSVALADEAALPACAQHIGAIDTVYFLGGVNIEHWHPRSTKELRDVQTASTAMLLRLVKAIEAQNASRRRWSLRIVSNAVAKIADDDVIQPFTAGLLGFAKALTNELPHVATQWIDLALGEGVTALTPELGQDLDRVIAGVGDGQQLALRGGKAYRRTLRPASLPQPQASALRDDGVYVIVGGAGNVGVRISQYLAERCGANIAWIGRRAADDAMQAQCADVAAGRVRYYQADIGDDKKLAKALQKIEAEMGALRGVFHSAMAFSGGRLATLSEAEFNDALHAKTIGSHALYRALKGRDLDFLMFFSSGEAFVGNKGWGAYTVACNFQDAFSLHLREETGCPVHVINWGFWEGNDRGDPELLRAKGIYPLNGEQGGQAIERLLASGLGQVMALNVSDAVLERMGVELPKPAQPAPAKPTPRQVVESKAAEAGREAGKVIEQISQQAKVAHVEAALTVDAVAQSVRAIVADTLMIEREKIDLDADLADFGVDSLIVVNLHRALEELAGTLPATLFLNYQSVREVAEFLINNHVEQARQLLGGSAPAAVAVPTETQAPAPVAADETPVQVVTTAAGPTAAELSDRARVLRRIPADQIESFLFSYGDLFREGQLANAQASGTAEVGADELLHLLVEVPSCPQVEVFVTGEGSPLVLMPAVALTAPVWLKQLESLRTQHRLIVIHAPGYGLSKAIRESTAAGVSRVFSEVLQRLIGAQPAHLVSSCFGSIAAAHLARFHPEQVASLSMVGGFYDGADLPPVTADNLSIEEVMQMIQTVSGSLKLDFDTVAAQWPADDARRLETERMGGLLIGSQCANPLVAMRYLNEMITLSTLDWVREIRRPLNFVFGDLDTVIRPVHSQTMHDATAGSGLVEIKGSGHYPFLTHPGEFDDVLTRFVTQVDAAHAPATTTDASVLS